MKLKIYKDNENRYWICDSYCRAMSGRQQDENISKQINLDLLDYMFYLMDNFNGKVKKHNEISKGVYFINEDDSYKAIEWIESLEVINRLEK